MKAKYLLMAIACLVCGSVQGYYKIHAYNVRSVHPDSIHQPITKFLDNWHRAAAEADTIFFDALSEESIYIGTDATERWTKQQFKLFAMPYFKKGKAWDFKGYDRDIHVSADCQYVWFSELLTTWMGICRGSGILKKTNRGWTIEQYHLSVTVPNNLIRDFIDLIQKSPAKK